MCMSICLHNFHKEIIRRVCRDNNDPDLKKLLYCSIVRQELEYSCELWSPYTSKDKLLLENVQRRATMFQYLELSKGYVLQGSAL